VRLYRICPFGWHAQINIKKGALKLLFLYITCVELVDHDVFINVFATNKGKIDKVKKSD
jgi:hypothetical protein